MKSQRIFSVMIFTGLMIISAVSVHAQTGTAAELKKRIFAEIARGTARQSGQGVEAEQAVPLTTQRVGLLGADKKKSLLGTWNLTLTFGDGFQVKSTLQVMPGRSDTEGTVIHASEFSLTLPNPTVPEQGVWEYSGGQQFIASYRGYAFTETFEPFGAIGFRHAITMDADQESFTGRAVFEVVDAAGQVLFSDTCQTRGVRQHAVAP